MAYDAKKRAEEINSGGVPSKEEMVTMSKAELDTVLQKVKDEFAEKLDKANDQIEKLKLSYEKDSTVKHIKNRGQYADDSITINQLGPLGPKDHQALSIKNAGVEEKLKGKVGRFVNNNPELRSLRRSQGYEPVRDKEGNEVRYMDGVLMAMPKDRYKQEVAEPAKVRKDIHKRAIRGRFEEVAAKHNVEVFGDGIQYDGGNE